MSDREFDNYLTLLAKLLRLDSRQRERIASELRAHLEDRLDELLAGGMPRDEAVKLALAEFGDAAGLAAEFGSLSRNRKRRWLMRVTTFSAAAIVLFAAGLAIFWPGRNAGPGVAALVAQDPADTKPKLDPEPAPATDPEPRPLEVLLEQRIDAEFEGIPLRDVLKFIEDSSGIQFYPQEKVLGEVGLDLDVPITKHLRKVRISTLLELMLRDIELTYYEKDNLVVITSPEEAESILQVRVYDCRDLLALPLPGKSKGMLPPEAAQSRTIPSGLPLSEGLHPGVGALSGGGQPPSIGPPRTDSALPEVPAAPRAGASRSPSAIPREVLPQFGGAAPPGASTSGGLGGGMGGLGMGEAEPRTEHEKHADSLINLITTNVDPSTWDEVGGPGTISEYHGLIVVTQTAQIHKKVERVLDMLREAAGLEVGGAKKVVR